MNLKEMLMQKGRSQQLAHFYIVESSLPETEATEQLMSFVHDFIRSYYQQIEGSKQSLVHLMDHPDVFVMGQHPDYEDKKDPDYIVAEAEQLIKFFEMKPIQSRRKFAVIPEGHKMTKTVANKWLKLLEEPNGESTIFLLNPRRQKLLDTIHSRAQHLRLAVSSSESNLDEWLEFLRQSQSLSLAAFLDKNLKQERDVFYWTQELIRWEATQQEKIEAKLALAEWIKKLQEMETFHQPSATKWALFYAHLQQHVLPRITR
jgi:hypothetical protein